MYILKITTSVTTRDILMQTLRTPAYRTLLHTKYFPSSENIRPNAHVVWNKKKIKEHSRARVYIPWNGVKLRKATLTRIKLLLAASASRVAYGFDDCIDARCAFRKSILSLKQLRRALWRKNATQKSHCLTRWTRCASREASWCHWWKIRQLSIMPRKSTREARNAR